MVVTSYNICKFLVPNLTPFSKNQYTVCNSKEFSDSICSVANADDVFMTSFDVESLYTNIPAHETIDICLNYAFSYSEFFYEFFS